MRREQIFEHVHSSEKEVRRCKLTLNAWLPICKPIRTPSIAAMLTRQRPSSLMQHTSKKRGSRIRAPVLSSTTWSGSAHIDLSDFRIQGQQVTCTYHEINELDRAVGYAGSRRQADFAFSQDHIATLVIHPLDPQERQNAHRLISPFFTWVKTTHPAEWARMSQLSYESGATLASMAHAWAASRSSP
jgi:hypothetical protein